MRLILLGAIFVSSFALANVARAATISPDTDASGLFEVVAQRDITVGTDPRTDPGVAVQTSYFGFREMTAGVRSETPFAPEMPQVGPRHEVSLPPEEFVALTTRR